MSKYLRQLLNEVKQKPSWSTSELVEKITQKMKVESEEISRYVPEDVQVGDVTIVDLHRIPHPAIVIKVENDSCSCVIASTTEGPHCVAKIPEARGFPTGGWICSTVMEIPKEEVLKRWRGQFFSSKQVKIIASELKRFFKERFKED